MFSCFDIISSLLAVQMLTVDYTTYRTHFNISSYYVPIKSSKDFATILSTTIQHTQLMLVELAHYRDMIAATNRKMRRRPLFRTAAHTRRILSANILVL